MVLVLFIIKYYAVSDAFGALVYEVEEESVADDLSVWFQKWKG